MHIVDSWPIIEHYLRDWSHPLFEELLTRTNQGVRLLMHEVNAGEVFYLVAKKRGAVAAKHTLQTLEQLGIEVVAVQAGDAMRAAQLKAVYPVSYADCFCADLAIARQAPVLTGDRDFLALQAAGLLTVHWLGA